MTELDPALSANAVGHLEHLGLSHRSARVYLRLLTGVKTVEELAAELRDDAADIVAQLTLLTGRGMVFQLLGEVVRYQALDPKAALGPVIQAEKEDLDDFERVVEDLSVHHQSSDPAMPGPEDFLQVVVGAQAVRSFHWLMLAEAQQEVLGFTKLPMLTIPQDAAETSQMNSALERGVPQRWIWTHEVLESPGMMAAAQDCLELGEDLRVLPDLPIKLCVVDRRVACVHVVEPTSDGQFVAGLVTRHPALVAGFADIFEFCWHSAVSPFDVGQESADRELTEYLAAGLKDDAIARSLGISARTLSRRVSNLLQHLHVETRFQAGLKLGRTIETSTRR